MIVRLQLSEKKSKDLRISEETDTGDQGNLYVEPPTKYEMLNNMQNSDTYEKLALSTSARAALLRWSRV